MKGTDYNDYVMRCEILARKANYITKNEETYDMFLQGLPKSLLQDTLKPPIPLNYNKAKERVKLLAKGRAVIKGILKKSFMGGTLFQCLNNQTRWPFFQNNWQSNNQQRNCPQSYNSTNAPQSMNNIPVPMDLSRGCTPNNWKGWGNGNWRQGRRSPARGNVSAPGYRSSSACFNCGKEGHCWKNRACKQGKMNGLVVGCRQMHTHPRC